MTSPRQAILPKPVLAALRGQCMNLAELAGAIAADRNLCCRVIDAAIQECGWPGLSLEQAVVLLGRERLVAQFLLTSNPNRAAQAGKPGPPRALQAEPEPGQGEPEPKNQDTAEPKQREPE